MNRAPATIDETEAPVSDGRHVRLAAAGRGRHRRSVFAPLVCSGVACAALSALAPPAQALDKVECVTAHEGAQEMRQRHAMKQAREYLVICSDPTCPSLVREDCGAWLAEMNRPTAQETSSSLDEPAVRAPVPHLDVERDEPEARAEREPEPPAPSRSAPVLPQRVRHESSGPDPDARSLRAPLLSGVLATAALSSAAYFGLSGLAQVDRLRHTCSPHCDSAEVASVQRRFLIADLSLLAGVGLGAFTAWSLWETRDEERPASISSLVRARGEPAPDATWSVMASVASLGVQYGGRF